jgi:hypothetical protein
LERKKAPPRAESPPQFFRINEEDGLEYEICNAFGNEKLIAGV